MDEYLLIYLWMNAICRLYRILASRHCTLCRLISLYADVHACYGRCKLQTTFWLEAGKHVMQRRRCSLSNACAVARDSIAHSTSYKEAFGSWLQELLATN
jgi:hypothetical protein